MPRCDDGGGEACCGTGRGASDRTRGRDSAALSITRPRTGAAGMMAGYLELTVCVLHGSFGPSHDLNAPIWIYVQDKQMRATADGTVLAVLLAISGAEVDGDDDLLAA